MRQDIPNIHSLASHMTPHQLIPDRFFKCALIGAHDLSIHQPPVHICMSLYMTPVSDSMFHPGFGVGWLFSLNVPFLTWGIDILG